MSILLEALKKAEQDKQKRHDVDVGGKLKIQSAPNNVSTITSGATIQGAQQPLDLYLVEPNTSMPPLEFSNAAIDSPTVVTLPDEKITSYTKDNYAKDSLEIVPQLHGYTLNSAKPKNTASLQRWLVVSAALAFICVFIAWWYLSANLQAIFTPTIHSQSKRPAQVPLVTPNDTKDTKIIAQAEMVRPIAQHNSVKQDLVLEKQKPAITQTEERIEHSERQATQKSNLSSTKNREIYSSDNVYMLDIQTQSGVAANNKDNTTISNGRNTHAIKILRETHAHPNAQKINDAYSAYKRGHYQQAHEQYTNILITDPINRDALLGLAAIAIKHGNAMQASEYYLNLLRANPNDSTALSGLISLEQFSKESAGERINDIKSLLTRSDNTAPLQFALGNLYASESRWSDAQSAYFLAWQRDKENADYAYNLAVSLDHLGKHQSALEYYRLTLRLANNQQHGLDIKSLKVRVLKLSGNLSGNLTGGSHK